MSEHHKIAVLGGGSWATALVKILCNNLDSVNWWMRSSEAVEHILKFKHNPKYLPDLFAKAGEGFDVVLAENDARRHGVLKNLQARLFHRLFNFLSNSDLADPSLSSYSVLSRRAVDGLLELRSAQVGDARHLLDRDDLLGEVLDVLQ